MAEKINHALVLSDNLRKLLEASSSKASKNALLSDLRVFSKWAEFEQPIPCTELLVAEFIAAMSEQRTLSTITRYVSSISKAHELGKYPNPTKTELVRQAMAGLRRTQSERLKKAPALSADQLLHILENTSKMEWIGRRNRAILTIGWCGALRCSEICALDMSDIEEISQGIVVTIRRSKTDQEGKGYCIGIPSSILGEIIIQWKSSVENLYGKKEGPLFPQIGCGAVDRWFPNEGLRKRLTVRGVSKIIKGMLIKFGLNGSSHSLRRGFITEASRCGVPERVIQRHTRHRSLHVLREYIADGNIMEDNPLPAMFARLLCSG